MKRRIFLAVVLSSVLPCSAALAGERKRFVFKIKTKSGGIVGNIVIEAKDIEEAKYKLRQRYPDCEILEGHEKGRTHPHAHLLPAVVGPSSSPWSPPRLPSPSRSSAATPNPQ